MLLFGYGLTIETPCMKTWRGVKVPFILYIRIHYPTGSRIWFNIFGPPFLTWAKAQKINR